MTVQLMELETRGAMWLFVDLEVGRGTFALFSFYCSYFPIQQNPSLANHDFQDVDFDRPFHAVNLNLPESSAAQRTVYIGVYGDPIMASNTPKGFSLVAWSPPQ